MKRRNIINDLRKPPSQISLSDCRDEGTRELLKAATGSTAARGHLCLQTVSGAKFSRVSSRADLPKVRPLEKEFFRNTSIRLPVAGDAQAALQGNNYLAGYLTQCAAHINEEYMAAAVRAVEGLANDPRAAVMAMSAFNAGSPLHDALIKAGSGCLGRAQAWLLVASDDIDTDGGPVDNLVSLRTTAAPIADSQASQRSPGKSSQRESATGNATATVAFYHVSAARSADAAALCVLGTKAFAAILRSSSPRVTVLALSSAVPEPWLPSVCGGTTLQRCPQVSMRVLVFIKPMKQYWAAALSLVSSLQQRAVPPAAEALLRSIALQTPVSPASLPPHRDTSGGSSVNGHSQPHLYAEFTRSKTAAEEALVEGSEPARPMSLAMSEAAYNVRCNSDQKAAVEKLRSGVFLVHGPPGTGKSTTVFHMINTRIRPSSAVLITAARNVAVVALLEKLTRSAALARDVVVSGSERRLGAEAAPYLVTRLVQAPVQAGDRAWPHLAFLVYRALASLHAGAREAHAHAVVHGDPKPLEPFVHSTQEQLAAFDALQHTSQEERARLFGTPALAAVTPLPCLRLDREVTPVERLQARAAQALLLQQALYCLKQLRTHQVVTARRIRMCTIDSAPRLAQTFRTACGVLQKEVTDAALLPRVFPGEASPDALPVLPKLAAALLKFAVYGAFERLPENSQAPLAASIASTTATSGFPNCELRLKDARQRSTANAADLLAAHHLHPQQHPLKVAHWLASVALWAADRELLSWIRWPPARVHYPGAALPTVLVLAHCFAHPGSATQADALHRATLAKDSDAIAVAIDFMQKHEFQHPAAAASGTDDASGACVDPVGETVSGSIVKAIQAVHTQLQAARVEAAERGTPVGHAEEQHTGALAMRLAQWDVETLAHTLAGPLYALSTCRTSLLQAQRMHAERVRQAALAEQCRAHGLAAAEGLPAAELDAVASGLHALTAAEVSDLGDIVAGALLPEIRALQVGALRGTGWGFGPAGAPVEGVPVDVAIVDEAGCLPDYAMPTLLSFLPANLVLVGDPKQLQASSEFFNTHVPRAQGGLREDMQHHSRSTMERLARAGRAFATGGAHASMLATQYRMHADVCHLVSEHFYRGNNNSHGAAVLRTDADVARIRAELVTCMSTATQFHAPPRCACQLITVFEPERGGATAAASHHGVPRLGLTTVHRTGFSNTDEAFIAVHVAYLRLQQLLEAAERLAWTPEQRRERFRGAGGTPVVFILTPYRKQVFLCQQVLDALHALPDSLAHCIVVQTIDQCQGDEADAIVLSLVISFDPPHRSASPGQQQCGRMAVAWQLSTRQSDAVTATDYVQFGNRANVALSRARYHLSIVASASVQFCMRSVLGLEGSLWGRILDTRLSVEAGGAQADDGRIVFHGGASSEHDGCKIKPQDIGARGPQLLLSAKPGAPPSDAPRSPWSQRKICPGENVTLVDTADFTVQAVHCAFAALLLLAYHVDCLQCLVTEEEAWRRLTTDAGPLPQEASERHAEGARLRARLQPFRQALIRAELHELLLALFPCWTAAQCRAVLAEPLFDSGDVVLTAPPEEPSGDYPPHFFAPLLSALHAAKVAAVYHQGARAVPGSAAEVAQHIRPAAGGQPQRQPPVIGHAIVRMFQERQARGDQLFGQEDVRALACVCTRLQVMALLPDAQLRAYAGASPEAAEMLHIFGRMPMLLGSLGGLDVVNTNLAFPRPRPGGDWAAEAAARPTRLFFVMAWPMADTQWRHIVDENALMHLHTTALLNEVMTDSSAHSALSSPPGKRAGNGAAGRAETIKDAAAAATMHRLRRLAGGPSAATARDHAAFVRSARGAAALQRLRLLAAALPPVLALDARATLTASCRKVLQDAEVFHRLIAEGLDSGDIAAVVARAVLELETMEQASQRVGAAGAPAAPASMRGANTAHVLLVSTRTSWLQLLRHPHTHLCDPYGAFRRPEWALLDAAAAEAGGSGTQSTATTPATAASASVSAAKHTQRLHAVASDDSGASALGGFVSAGRRFQERQAQCMQSVLALMHVMDSGSGRVAAPAGAAADENDPAAIFRRRVWVASAAAASVSLRTVLSAEEMGGAREGTLAALGHAAAAVRQPAVEEALRRLAGTPWGGPPAAAAAQLPFHCAYTFLPIAQAGRNPATSFRVPPAERPAIFSRAQCAAPATAPDAGAAVAAGDDVPDAWNQCIDRAEVCVLLRELARVACGEVQLAGGIQLAQRHAVAAMGHLIAHFLTSHSPAALPPEMALSVQRQLFFTSWAVMDIAPRPPAGHAHGPEQPHPHGGLAMQQAAATDQPPSVPGLLTSPHQPPPAPFHIHVANLPTEPGSSSPSNPFWDEPMGQ
eukprot:jgi/Ulvmu1/12277/UM087_0011.1